MLHKSQCNDSALHLSCREASDGLRPHHFFFFLFFTPSVPVTKLPHHY